MKKVLVVTGSVRPNSVNKSVVEAVRADIAARQNVTVTIADLAELNLPFFDALTPPSAENYVVPYDNVERWGALVNDADGVVFVAPEYNHSLSAVQKNAIDWLYKEWKEKPVAFVGYGWHAGSHSLAEFKIVGSVVKWNMVEPVTGLQFEKEIDLNGAFLDEPTVRGAIHATADELVGRL